jgi:predicted hydrolase (HD superfamily)
MTREDAYILLTTHLKNPNLIKHCIACEVGMRAIYRHLTPPNEQNPADEEEWGITGLLHDVDYEIAQKENRLDEHGVIIFEKIPNTIPEKIAQSIKAHNFENTGVRPESPMDWAIADIDALTGLIVACALIHPDKKLASITTDFVIKRFGESSFAKGARRESISRCEETLNIPLKKFVELTLTAMQENHDMLGL